MTPDIGMDVGRAEWDALMAVRHLRDEVRLLPQHERVAAVDNKTLDEIAAEFFGLLGDLSIDRKQMARGRAQEAA